MEVVNWRMVAHPMNWVIVLLMLVIAAIFGHLLLSLLEQEPATSASSHQSTGLSDATVA